MAKFGAMPMPGKKSKKEDKPLADDMQLFDDKPADEADGAIEDGEGKVDLGSDVLKDVSDDELIAESKKRGLEAKVDLGSDVLKDVSDDELIAEYKKRGLEAKEEAGESKDEEASEEES